MGGKREKGNPPLYTHGDGGCSRRSPIDNATKIFEEFPHIKKRYWGRHFWARGYFCVTAGEMTKEMIQEYLAHHFEPDPDSKFEVEP